MTDFAIGLSAAALWVVVPAGVVLLMRSSSGTPQRSIRRFKGDRLAIKTARAAALSDSTVVFRAIAPHATSAAERSGPLIEAESPSPTFAAVRLNSDGLIVTEDVDASEGVQEIEALVGSVTDSREVTAPAGAAAPRTRPKITGGPRKKGRITYVLVDEEGRPQI